MAAKGLDLLVRGGRVVTPNEVLETAVGVSDGRIVALGAESMLPPAERTIDATGKYVLPGLIDCHVHLGAVYDDWHTGPVAAAHAARGSDHLALVRGVRRPGAGDPAPGAQAPA